VDDCHSGLHCNEPRADLCLPTSGGPASPVNLTYSVGWSAYTQGEVEEPWPPLEDDQAVADRVLKTIEPVFEEITPAEFLRRCIDLLKSIGTVHLSRVESGGRGLYSMDLGPSKDLDGLRGELDEKLRALPKDPSLEVSAVGKGDLFFVELLLTLKTVHSPAEAGLELSLVLRPTQFEPVPGEAADDFQLRMEKLVSDSDKFEMIQHGHLSAIESLKSDTAYHFALAFPGVELRANPAPP